MTSQSKNDDDEPIFVLQNCSAMSRQAAMSEDSKRSQRSRWGMGWFGKGENSVSNRTGRTARMGWGMNGDNSVSHRTSSVRVGWGAKAENSVSHRTAPARIAADENKGKEAIVADSKVDKSLLPTKASSSSVETKNKSTDNDSSKGITTNTINSTDSGPTLDKSALPTNASSASSTSITQPTDPVNSKLHPPSPKSLSPRDSSTGTNSSTKSSKTEDSKYAGTSDTGNGGFSPDELSRRKRREEIREKTAWYEEYIRNHMAKHGGCLSSLNKEELVALGLFDKQRRLQRRARLWGSKDSGEEIDLADEELEQLLVLADKCNKAQSDEAELEMMLVKMENNEEVDMDRLYHLELLSRKRVGEILNEQELNALQIFEENKKEKEELDSLRKRRKDGVKGIDEKRLIALTLLERKRNDDKSMTQAEFRSAEIIEMRHEDARLNKKDLIRLLRLKEQGKPVDEDRLNLLTLLESRRRGLEITEAEAEIVEQYFALREEEYLERVESKGTLENEKKATADKEQGRTPLPLIGEDEAEDEADDESNSEAHLEKRAGDLDTETDVDTDAGIDVDAAEDEKTDDFEKEQQPTENPKKQNKIIADNDKDELILEKKRDDSVIFDKETGEQTNKLMLHQAETSDPKQCETDSTSIELIDTKADLKLENSKIENNNETRSVTSLDIAESTISEKVALEELQRQLKSQGLPLTISFEPFSDDDECGLSSISFSDETFINDILLQKERRESDRKEECLEDAYKIYKRTIRKKKLPESEELLLKIFAEILKQKNDEMRDADIRFNELVEKVEQLSELRKEKARNERIENGGEEGNGMPTTEESAQPKTIGASAEEIEVRYEAESEKKHILQNQSILLEKADGDTSGVQNISQQSTIEGLDDGHLRSKRRGVVHDDVSQAEESRTTIEDSSFSQQSREVQTYPIEPDPTHIEMDRQLEAIKDEEVSDESNKSQDENRAGQINMAGQILIFPRGNQRKQEGSQSKQTIEVQTKPTERDLFEIEKDRKLEVAEDKEASRESNKEQDENKAGQINMAGQIMIFPLGNQIENEGLKDNKRYAGEMKAAMHGNLSENDDRNTLVLHAIDDVAGASDGFASEENESTGSGANKIKNGGEKTIVDAYIRESEVDKNAPLKDPIPVRAENEITESDSGRTKDGCEETIVDAYIRENGVSPEDPTSANVSIDPLRAEKEIPESDTEGIEDDDAEKIIGAYLERNENGPTPVNSSIDFIGTEKEISESDTEGIEDDDAEKIIGAYLERNENGPTSAKVSIDPLRAEKEIPESDTEGIEDDDAEKIIGAYLERNENCPTPVNSSIDFIGKEKEISESDTEGIDDDDAEKIIGAYLKRNENCPTPVNSSIDFIGKEKEISESDTEGIDDDDAEKIIGAYLERNENCPTPVNSSIDFIGKEKEISESDTEGIEDDDAEKIIGAYLERNENGPTPVNSSIDFIGKEKEISESDTEGIENDDAEKIIDAYLRGSGVGKTTSTKDSGPDKLPFDPTRVEELGKVGMRKQKADNSEKISPYMEDCKKGKDCKSSLSVNSTSISGELLAEENSIVEQKKLPNTDDTVVERDIETNHVVTVQKSLPVDVQNEGYSNHDEEYDDGERFVLLKDDGIRFSNSKAAELPVPGIDREKIETDLLYELDLITRLRKGIRLSEEQDYELDLLLTLRQGGTLSKQEVEDFNLLCSERELLTLHPTYLKDLNYRISHNKLVNDDFLYEIELFHKDLRGETMSNDELIELLFFDRRLNGEVLSDGDLEELEFLKKERLARLAIDQYSDGTKTATSSERSSRSFKDRSYSRSGSIVSYQSSTGHDSTDRIERTLDDEDSVYRRNLLGRQMAGKRLDKKEFEWLQILMKKSRNEALDNDELHELEIMRNQRNETEVNFVNTKKLLEKELRRQAKIKIKEQRRKEKEQRRKERKEREKMKKMRKKRTKSIVQSDIDAANAVKAVSDEKIDTRNSQDTTTEVQIIGGPTLQTPLPVGDKKEEPKMGVFGAVFKNAKKQRQEQQLEEAKRLQEELIKEHMKALALENEAEELEREKVMQEQLVQETIEKKKAASSVMGDSFASSGRSLSWETSSGEESSDESDDSSWTSSDTTSTSGDSGRSKEREKSQRNENESRESNFSEASSQPNTGIVESHISEVDRDAFGSSRVLDGSNGEPSLTITENGSHQIQSVFPDKFQGEQFSNHSGDAEKGSREEQRPRSASKGATRRNTLGSHFKKKKKKRSKHGDDVSLGTLQLTKAKKEGRNSQNKTGKSSKLKDRPWSLGESTHSATNTDHPDGAKSGEEDSDHEKSVHENSSFEFNPTFVSRISERIDEDEDDTQAEDDEESLSHVFSETEEEKELDEEKKDSAFEGHKSLIDSLNSFTSIGEEGYDLGLEEYDNIESRLGGKVKDKQAEFDLTWETTVADENVIIQINQRLKERQRELEAKREKKKEKKEIKDIREAPRLFLFEGEKIRKKGAKRKKKKHINKKLNRTLTREFRKAMKDVFDSGSESDDVYQMDMEEIRRTSINSRDDRRKFLIRSFSRKGDEHDDDVSEDPSDVSEYDDDDDGYDEEFAGDSANSDDESVQFDGDYLQRLKERSMPTNMKKMLSGRNLTIGDKMKSMRNLKSSRNMISALDSPDDRSSDSEDPKLQRRPKRKKTGEIVDPNIDPAEVYAQELEKQKGKKAFTIAGLRKEMEGINRNENFSAENNNSFGNFDGLAPPLMSPLIERNAIPNATNYKKKVSLGKGVESLERQRPKMRSTRSLNTTTSDQELLAGARRGRRNSMSGHTRTSTIDPEREKERVILPSRRRSSDSFTATDTENDKSIATGANGKLPNLKFFGTFKKTFKGKKHPEFESFEGGGLLNGATTDEFDTSESKGGFTDNSSFFNAVQHMARRDPLPLPIMEEEEEEIKHHRPNKIKFEKAKIKGVLSKLKLPGKSNHHRKYGGGIMMED